MSQKHIGIDQTVRREEICYFGILCGWVLYVLWTDNHSWKLVCDKVKSHWLFGIWPFSAAPLLSNTEAWLQDDGKCPPDVDMNEEDFIPTVQAESMHEQHMSAPTLPNSNQDVSSYQTQMSCQRYIIWCFWVVPILANSYPSCRNILQRTLLKMLSFSR